MFPRLLRSLLLLFPSVMMLFGISCRRAENYVNEEGLIWNTSFHVTYRGPESLRDSVLKVLQDVGSSLSVFDKNSLISKINASDSLPIDRHFLQVYMASLKVNSESEGRFDPTLSPLITAWGFGPGHKATPDTARVDSLLRFVGISKTRISNGCLVKDDPRIQFNLSAVAKGYGCDAVGEMLARNGVKDYLVEIGGEIASAGESPRGRDWKVSIDRPVFSPDYPIHESECIIRISGKGLATSGNYRNIHKVGKGHYGHTISPLTGRPVQTDVISATIVAPTCMEADAYATACMAMGSDASEKMVERLKLPAMLVLADSTVWINDYFRKLITE